MLGNTFSIDDFRTQSNNKHSYYTRISRKPIKNGVTTHMCAEKCETLPGIVLQLIPYCGKHTVNQEIKISSHESVTMNYVNQIVKKNYDEYDSKHDIYYVD